MRRIQRNKKALSTVVTTLIILVVSVLLAGVVTLYATNITATRTQQEQLKLTKQSIWVMANGTAYAALNIDNVGGKDVLINKIQVRGVESSWASVHYLRLSTAFTSSLNAPNATINWSSFAYTSGTTGSFSAASTTLPLRSSETLVAYIHGPDSVTLSDIGVTIGITVFTESTQYYAECNVKTSVTA